MTARQLEMRTRARWMGYGVYCSWGWSDERAAGDQRAATNERRVPGGQSVTNGMPAWRHLIKQRDNGWHRDGAG